jgi:hypothetical protein
LSPIKRERDERLTATQNRLVELGQTLEDGLTRGFIKAFDVGDSLIDQMLAKIASAAFATGLGALIGMIPGLGPVGAAIGMSGFGGGVKSLTNSYGGGTSKSLNVSGMFRMRGQDMVLVLDKAQQISRLRKL